MIKTVTITEEHLTRAIADTEADVTGAYQATCIAAQAVRDVVPQLSRWGYGSGSVEGSKLVFLAQGEKREVATQLLKIISNFDGGHYDEVRSRLPFTFNIFVPEQENL